MCWVAGAGCRSSARAGRHDAAGAGAGAVPAVARAAGSEGSHGGGGLPRGRKIRQRALHTKPEAMK